jgi:hypothetical protein
MAAKSTLKPWAIQMLMQWHHLDPVSAKEQMRNEAAYNIQHNRNPFIDEPRFADCIWLGNCMALNVASRNTPAFSLRVAPNPARTNIQIEWQSIAPDEVLAIDVMNIQGALIYHCNPARDNISVDVNDWPQGMYLLRVKTQHGIRIEKILVK